SLVDSDNGLAWDYYPGAPNGGVQTERNLTAPGWLPKDSPRLAGNTAHVYNDANDDNTAEPSEEITPSGKRAFDFPFQNFNPADPTDPFIPSNGGDEADVVYHEYTHGLSNRLVVDANGVSTLGNVQAGSMGEAWSDWYAMDFLTNQGFQPDTPDPGDVRIGNYVGAGQDLIRTQPMDCPVGTTSPKCPGTPGAGPGGYTYGDFGHIIGIPEVHA